MKNVEKFFSVAIFKVTEGNTRIRSEESDPDPLVRGTDPRIQIRTKMSRIRNTVLTALNFCPNLNCRYGVPRRPMKCCLCWISTRISWEK